MLVDDLERLTSIEQLSVSRAGDAAFVASRIEFDQDRYHRRICVVDAKGAIFDLTHGPFDRRPRWSPDGAKVAFLRQSDRETKAQVAVIEIGKGEAHIVTDFALGATDMAWDPESRRLAVVGTEWRDEAEDDEERARRPRRIRTLPYRSDAAGWTHDRHARIWLVDPSGAEDPVPLTNGEADESAPAWSHDGGQLSFLSDRSGRKVGSHATQIWEKDLESGQLSMRADLGYWTALAYRPDGPLYAIGIDDFDDWPAPLGLWTELNQVWTNLTSHLDRTLTPSFTDVTWLDLDAVVLLDDGGSTGIIRVEPDGTTHHLTRRDTVVTDCGAAGDASQIVYVSTTMLDPGEVRRIEVGETIEATLTNLNLQFRGGVSLEAGEHFEVVSDGVDIDAWAYLPPGAETVPMLLNIHGGPAAQYGVGFFDEFQVYVAAGYGVVACNPRGSSGRGREFLKAVTGEGWGVVDLADVQSVVDAALARFPRLDPERLGVMGGSYGGYLTAWLTAHDSRFQSAVVERGLISWPSFVGTSDIGATFPFQYLGQMSTEESTARSPLSVADRITAPTLIVHSENDYRCPISQAEELFTVLLRQGTPTEFMRFPEESHELSRSGQPCHRRERFEAILDWHQRWLADNPLDLAN